jgi:hypothetical protein
LYTRFVIRNSSNILEPVYTRKRFKPFGRFFRRRYPG